MDDNIKLRLVAWGERYVEVDRAEYQDAIEDDDLEFFLDADASKIEAEWGVIDEDGRMFVPLALGDAPRRTVLAHDAGGALTDIIAQARPVLECIHCTPVRLCPGHLAEHILDALHLEQLTIVPFDKTEGR